MDNDTFLDANPAAAQGSAEITPSMREAGYRAVGATHYQIPGERQKGWGENAVDIYKAMERARLAQPAPDPIAEAERRGAEAMRERCARVASTVYSRMFPRPRNRITAENAGFLAASDIRVLSTTPEDRPIGAPARDEGGATRPEAPAEEGRV